MDRYPSSEDKQRWYQIQQYQLEKHNEIVERQRRSRIKLELFLVATCVVAMLFPYANLDNQTEGVTIPAINLIVSSEVALALFPIIIASFYLIFIGVNVRHNKLRLRLKILTLQLENYQATGSVFEEDDFKLKTNIKNFLLPTVLGEQMLPLPDLAEKGVFIVNVIIGAVFILATS